MRDAVGPELARSNVSHRISTLSSFWLRSKHLKATLSLQPQIKWTLNDDDVSLHLTSLHLQGKGRGRKELFF